MRNVMTIFALVWIFVPFLACAEGAPLKKYPHHLHALKSIVLTGEPVVVEVSVTNESRKTLSLVAYHRFPYRVNDYMVTNDKGEKILGGAGIQPSMVLVDSQYVHIPNNMAYIYRERLTSIGPRLLWPEPGEYTIQMEPADLGYPSVTINVIAPEGRNKEAYGLWREYNEEIDLAIREEKAQHIMSAYGDTVYGQWLIFDHAGESYTTESSHARMEQLIIEDDSRALDGERTHQKWVAALNWAQASTSEKLIYLIEKCHDFPLIDECLVRLAQLDPDKESRRVKMEAIIKEYPDSPAAWMAKDDINK